MCLSVYLDLHRLQESVVLPPLLVDHLVDQVWAGIPLPLLVDRLADQMWAGLPLRLLVDRLADQIWAGLHLRLGTTTRDHNRVRASTWSCLLNNWLL